MIMPRKPLEISSFLRNTVEELTPMRRTVREEGRAIWQDERGVTSCSLSVRRDSAHVVRWFLLSPFFAIRLVTPQNRCHFDALPPTCARYAVASFSCLCGSL